MSYSVQIFTKKSLQNKKRGKIADKVLCTEYREERQGDLKIGNSSFPTLQINYVSVKSRKRHGRVMNVLPISMSGLSQSYVKTNQKGQKHSSFQVGMGKNPRLKT